MTATRLAAHRAALDANMVETFTRTIESVGDSRGTRARFGRVDVILTGVDVAYFNIVFVLDRAARPADVLAASSLMRERAVPFVVFVRDDVGPALRSAVIADGLVEADASIPGMVLDPIARLPAPIPDGVRMQVGGAEFFDDWHAALESDATLRRVFGRSFVADPGVRLAVAYLDGLPISGAAVVDAGGVIGIYSLWTQESARRRGIGGAVTRAAIDAGVQAWGATAVVLQSSPMGEPLYRSMGFETVSRYAVFASPANGGA
ncbi:MAG: GNAT family N-acetyltransferase [Candidatus Limnocylindrales bacterium]